MIVVNELEYLRKTSINAGNILIPFYKNFSTGKIIKIIGNKFRPENVMIIEIYERYDELEKLYNTTWYYAIVLDKTLKFKYSGNLDAYDVIT